MVEFVDQDLRGSRFAGVDLSGAQFRLVRLEGADFRFVELADVTMRGVELVNVAITGEIVNVTVNGVDIGPLVDAELDRRDPGRVAMRASAPAEFVAAWALLDRLWAGTIERARTLDPALLHESVDGEWSFIETLRHLVFATDAWVRRGIQGDPAPWDPLDLPWDQMLDTPGVPRDREVRPSMDTVLALRRDRTEGVRVLLSGLTERALDAGTEPVEGPGWPESRSYPVRDCLLVVLNEEFQHRLYAERDLGLLVARATAPTARSTSSGVL